MGIFDFFGSKPDSDPLARLRKIAPELFPGGHEQIVTNGRKIAAMLDNRIPVDAGARIYASTKYLAHTAADKSKARVVAYIVRQGMGRITEDESAAIYDMFISERPNPNQGKTRAAEPQGTIYFNAQIAEVSYTIYNTSRRASINAAVFSLLLLGLRSNGWQGASYLFLDHSEMMKPLEGTILIQESDARYIAEALSNLPALRGQNELMDIALDILVNFGKNGSYYLQT